jgi:hypothetical protein
MTHTRVAFLVLAALPFAALADTSEVKTQSIIEVRKGGAHCADDPHCMNRYHYAIKPVARAQPGRAAPCRRVNGNRGRGDDPVRQALPSRSVFLVVLAARILGFHLAARRGLVRLGVREGWDGRQGRAKRHHHQQRSGGGQQTLEGSFHCSLLAGRHAPVARDMRASCQPANALPVQALGANCRATETPPGVGAAQQIAVARPSRATSPSRRAALPAAEASSAAAPRVRRFVDVAVERLRAECF